MRQDISDCIFQQKVVNEEEPKLIENAYYGFIDDYDFLDSQNNPRLEKDDERTFAKKIIKSDGSHRLFVKTNASKKIYNPMSMYGKDEIGSKFLDKTCKDFKFKAVNLKVFNLYLNFLRTKNLSWLHNAEREAE